LFIQKPVRAAIARAAGTLVAVTAVVSLTAGGAYLIGAAARASVMHSKIERLAGAAREGFSDQALETAATADPNALIIARRFDTFASEESSEREIRLAAFAENLEARRTPAPAPVLQKASYTSTSTPGPTPAPSVTPARPFHFRGALEESRDLECLTQAVYYEARGEGAAGQAAVAQVVLNRSRHPAFPKSVCGVVYQGVNSRSCQFSFACDGSVNRRVDQSAWRRAEKVAARALAGSVMEEVGTATHFHVTRVSPNWGSRLRRVAQIGTHVFYRFGGRSGSGSAFSATPVPSEPAPTTETQAQPIYASLTLAPLANTVATTMANSVAGAAAAGAELVMSATSPKPVTRPITEPAAKPASAPVAAPATAPATAAEAVQPVAAS
jgi:hypothetical protein